MPTMACATSGSATGGSSSVLEEARTETDRLAWAGTETMPSLTA